MDPSRLNTRIARATQAAADDTLHDIQAHQAHRTGRLRASEHVTGTGHQAFGRIRLTITSPVVYANAVEFGANARAKASVAAGTKRSRSKKKGDMQGPLRNRATRRGPHMSGNHVVAEQGPRFIAHMTERLRSTT